MIAAYIQHGWKLCAVPPATKGPTSVGWNRLENALTSLPPQGWGVGLLHAYSETAAIDLDNIEAARTWLAERGVDLDALLNAPDAVQIISGRPNSGKLLYRMPMGLALPSRKVATNSKVILEMRCASANGLSVQDVLPPSVHPSGTIYQWAGRGNWQNPPEMPVELLNIWYDLMNEDSRRNIPLGEGAVPADMTEVKSALYAINPDCPRRTWIDVGMAMQAIAEESGKHNEMFELWREWSSTGKKFIPSEMTGQWASFKPMRDGIGPSTLFYHAGNHGWKRPIPDVSSLFKPVPKAEVKDIKFQMSPTPGIPDVDLRNWPSVLATRAVEVGVQVGCDATVPLMAGLCAVSAAADKRIKLHINGSWEVPPNFWIMTIGEPSDKKTPGSKPMFKVLRDIEKEDQQRFAAEMMTWSGKEAQHASEMKIYRDWWQSPDSQLPNSVPPTVTPLPPQPQSLRMVVQDATTQKLVSMAEGRPRGFLLYLDEMARWLTKLADPRTTDDRGCWIQGYETGPYNFDRMGAGSIFVENMALSIYGNCQPAVFRQNVTAASTDGIMQRFMPIMLNPEKNAMWKAAVPEFMSAEPDYDALVRRTYALPERTYHLSERAMMHFKGFCEWALELREDERILKKSDTYMTALGKLEGQCARLILLFHLCNNPYAEHVDESTAIAAINEVKHYFWLSMLYVYNEVAKQRDRISEAVFDTVLQMASVRPSITLSELRRGSMNTEDKRPQSQIDMMLRVAMDDLASFGYVTLLQDHPRYPVWVINPQMADDFKDERNLIIGKKQKGLSKMQASLITEHDKFVLVPTAIGFNELFSDGGVTPDQLLNGGFS